MIVNPASASATTEGRWVESEKILSDAGLDVCHVCTERPAHAIELVGEYAAKGYRRFIAVGGDGTIHEVMTVLLRYCDASSVSMGEFTLAVLPYGTGNDWIKTSGIPADLSEAAKCIIKGNTARQDVVRMTFDNGTFCMANIGGVGLDADICYNTNTLKQRGRKGDLLYKLVAPYSIFSKKRGPVEIECDGEQVFKGKLYSVVIVNGTYRGGGLRQNAEDTWDDGQLEVSIMPGFNRIKGLSKMMHVFSGDFATLKGIISRRFRTMTIKPLGEVRDRVESDGEIPGTIPLTVELTGEQINIIVP